MQVFFLGNCQTNALQAILKDVTTIRPTFGSITEFWGDYDPASIDAGIDAADIVIAMAVTNPDHPYSAQKLRAQVGSKLVLTPYIYIDGIASLEKIASKGRAIIRGADELKSSEHWPHKAKMLDAFTRGRIDMRQQERLFASLARLGQAESDHCDIVISDYISETYSSRPLLYGINHPTQHVLFKLFERLAAHVDITPQADKLNDPITWAKRALPANARSLCPSDVATLGLAYEPDDHWYGHASQLIHLAVAKSD